MLSYFSARLGEKSLQDLKEQSVRYDLAYHLVNAIWRVQRCRGGYEVLVGWVGYAKSEDEFWEPLLQILKDLSGMLEEFLHMEGNQNLKLEILDLYFKLRIASKDEFLGRCSRSTALSSLIIFTDIHIYCHNWIWSVMKNTVLCHELLPEQSHVYNQITHHLYMARLVVHDLGTKPYLSALIFYCT